jgi:hypothetical protein
LDYQPIADPAQADQQNEASWRAVCKQDLEEHAHRGCTDSAT